MPATSQAVTTTSDASSDGVGPGDEPREGAWDLLVLAGACFFAPLIVWANSAERAGVVGFALLGSMTLALALAARLGMTRLGLDLRGSTYAVAVFVFGFTNAGLLLDRGFARPVVALGLVLVSAMAYALRRSGVFRAVLLWGGIFVLAYPALAWASSGSDPAGGGDLPAPEPLAAVLTGERRDVVLIVLDGYANSRVLEEMYGYDTSRFEAELTARGFDPSPATVANYGRTRFSVSSVVQLGYPVGAGPLSDAGFDHLLEVIGGQNVLTSWLRDNGYTHTYVESGWFGTRCTAAVDRCVEGPWPDESLYDVTNRSLLKDLPGFETGRSFTRGARHVLDWLSEDLAALLRNGEPDLVYAHVLAPHPPLFLDSACVFRPGDGFGGFTIARPGMSETELAEAREWYGRQVDCVNNVLVRVAGLAEETDSIVVMFGDHGPDSLGQLFIAGAEWSEEQRWERLSAMLAARVPGCDMSEIDSLVNAGRRMVSCISDAELADLPTRTFESEPVPGGQRMVEVPPPSYRSSS